VTDELVTVRLTRAELREAAEDVLVAHAASCAPTLTCDCLSRATRLRVAASREDTDDR
jgi:hypothetical protein